MSPRCRHDCVHIENVPACIMSHGAWYVVNSTKLFGLTRAFLFAKFAPSVDGRVITLRESSFDLRIVYGLCASGRSVLQWRNTSVDYNVKLIRKITRQRALPSNRRQTKLMVNNIVFLWLDNVLSNTIWRCLSVTISLSCNISDIMIYTAETTFPQRSLNTVRLMLIITYCHM